MEGLFWIAFYCNALFIAPPDEVLGICKAFTSETHHLVEWCGVIANHKRLMSLHERINLLPCRLHCYFQDAQRVRSGALEPAGKQTRTAGLGSA